MDFRAEDVDARARDLEQARREGEDRFRVLAEATFEGIVITEAGRIIDANAVYCEMMGYELSELKGKSVLELVAPEGRDLAERIIASHSDVPYEAPCTRRDGTTFLAEIRGKVMPHQGRTLRVAAVRDISERKRMETAIRESEARYRAISELSSDYYFRIAIDRQGDMVVEWITDGFEQLTGYRLADIERPYMWEGIVHTDDLPLLHNFFQIVVGGQESECKLRLNTRQGNTLWISILGRAEWNRLENKVCGVLGAAKDITERELAEASLRASEERFRSLFEDSPMGMAITGPGLGFLKVNRAWCEMLGYTEEEMLSMGSRDVTHPDDLEKTRVLAGQLFRGEIPTYRNEKRFIAKSGRTVWASVTTMLIYDQQGTPNGLGIVEDMTQRMRAREAIKDSEERFRMLSASTFEAVSITEGGRFLDVNATFEKMFGYGLNEMSDMSAFDFVLPEYRDVVRRTGTSDGEDGCEAVCLKRDGTPFFAEIRGRPVPYHGRIAQVTTVRDITPRKRAEESLKAAMKELEAFSYSVSHDLRAPLRGLDGFSRKLLENYADRMDERGIHYLERIRAASQRMAQLIDDMLNLSRITRAEMRREPVDLSLLARSIAQELRKMDPGRNVEIIIQDGLMAHGDARLLRVVLENLVANAWKFTGKHEAARIELGTMAEGGKPVYFVKDDGAGFDMECADKLFGAFQRLHSMTEFVGTGVGLATVQRIIHRHGGRVWAEGIVERGATLYFTL